jgi:hypothetical protein
VRGTTLHGEMRTVIEDGEADEAIGVDVLVDGDVSNEDDLRRLDGLR